MRILFRKTWYLAAWFCLVLETGSLGFLQTYLGRLGSPLLFVMSGLFLTLSLLAILKRKINEGPGAEQEAGGRSFRRGGWVVALLFAGFFSGGWLFVNSVLPRYPVDAAHSDILPLIRLMAERFMTHQPVYAETHAFGYRMFPTYLPMTWLPYLASAALHLDYRLFAYLIFSLCVLSVTAAARGRRVQNAVMVTVCFLILLIYVYEQPETMGWTVEAMVAGFYLLLLAGLRYRHTGLLVVSLVCCLLSRYAIILVLPFMAAVSFFLISRRQTRVVAGLTAFGLLLLFVLPFLVRQPDILSRSYAYYTEAALSEWKGQSWQQPGALPYQLAQGYGFALFFYRPENLAGSLRILQHTQLLICLFLPLAASAWFFLKGRKWLPAPLFLLLLLHLYLVFFFAFIQVPYAYLFLTPVLLAGCATVLVCWYRPTGGPKRF